MSKIELTFASRYYLKIFDILPKFSSRLVGGCVRDAFLGKSSMDIDIVTKLKPQEVTDLLENHNIKVIPTGIKFGGVTAIYKDEKFEITTVRKDINPSGRYTEVEYSNSFEIDAARRDFTINALSYCPYDKRLYDYYGGIDDSKNKIVRFIGSANKRIEEDYLRILRFFRFSAYYATTIDDDGFKASVLHRANLDKISKERIHAELDKIIMSPSCAYILELMNEANILLSIFMLVNLDYLKMALIVEPNISKDLRYSLLLVDNLNISVKTFIDLKFTRAEAISIIKKIEIINGFNSKEYEYNLESIWLNNDNFTEIIIALAATDKISKIQAQDFIRSHRSSNRPKFQINGDDLISIGYKGQVLGQRLAYLKNRWIKSKYQLDKSTLLKLCE